MRRIDRGGCNVCESNTKAVIQTSAVSSCGPMICRTVRPCPVVSSCLLLSTDCALHGAFRGCSKMTDVPFPSNFVMTFLHLVNVKTGLKRSDFFLLLYFKLLLSAVQYIKSATTGSIMSVQHCHRRRRHQ